MKKQTFYLLYLSLSIFLFSCASSKSLKTAEKKYSQLDSAYAKIQNELRACQDKLKSKEANEDNFKFQKSNYDKKIADLEEQLNYLKKNNNVTLSRLKDLSVITQSQAESINKSLENIGYKDLYINDLKRSIAYKDSLNNALVMNLKSALLDINDKDINIKVEKDVVYVDISDKLLFKSGKYDVTESAKNILSKVARVLKAHPDLEFMIEGNTDSNPFTSVELKDNWDLSVKRATSVARLLQNTYHLDPKHITAAGKGEYSPIATNATKEGRASNRRTRIIILPQLDQFFKLLEKK